MQIVNGIPFFVQFNRSMDAFDMKSHDLELVNNRIFRQLLLRKRHHSRFMRNKKDFLSFSEIRGDQAADIKHIVGSCLPSICLMSSCVLRLKEHDLNVDMFLNVKVCNIFLLKMSAFSNMSTFSSCTLRLWHLRCHNKVGGIQTIFILEH